MLQGVDFTDCSAASPLYILVIRTSEDPSAPLTNGIAKSKIHSKPCPVWDCAPSHYVKHLAPSTVQIEAE
ncbi:hypothetical protein Agabi119p4_5046 [Agaricus bisporus var. burnettii]|uniref:Uncharacterized protein n=1 Tax=Agaricus bisporus var. burnettii TaxID=192524 RepID=A0A8H7F4G1_AGABI|nr:hypothetical protein Agabi119p4_5046 [Agaricus bisporus var. burnettii]